MGSGASSVDANHVASMRMCKTPGDDNEYMAYLQSTSEDGKTFTVIWSDDPSETPDDTCCAAREYSVVDAFTAKKWI